MGNRIFHIQQLLSQTLGEYWTVERMADIVGLSPDHFKYRFKKVVGISPMAYLLNLRLEKAHEYLSDPLCFLQIQEIRLPVGFTDDSHFTRNFKKKYGLAPTQCRLQACEKYQDDFKNSQE